MKRSKKIHDIRTPLAKAKTIAKLLNEATPEEREMLIKKLLVNLDELEKLIELPGK